MKAKKNNRKAKFGQLGVVSLLALSLSSQSIFAMDLWYSSGPKKDQKLTDILDKDKTEAVEWLRAFDVSQFVEKFKQKPNQFVKGLYAAIKDQAFEKEFKDKLQDSFKNLEEEKFGGAKQKEAYLSIVNSLLTLTEETEDKRVLELGLAFSENRAALNVTDRKPRADEESPEVGEQAPGEDAAFKAFCDTVRATLGQRDDQVGRLEQQLKDLQQQREEEAQAAQLANNQANEALQNQLAQMQALLNQNAQEQPARNNNDRDASDVLNGLLSSLVNDQNARNAQEEITPPANNNQFPFFPQQQRLNNVNPNQFNQPLPQANNMPFLPQQNSAGLQVPVTYDLGVTGGRPELADAQEILSVNEMRQPVAATLSPMATIQDLVVAKARVSSDVKRTQVALQNAKDKAGQLDERLEELKEGGRAALSPSVKQRLAQLKQAVETKQSYLNQQRQMLSMLSPDQREQLNNTLMSAQQDLSNAEQQYNQYNSQVEVAVEQANGQIKALAKQRDQLNSAVNKLQTQMGSLKEDETAVTQLINNQMQAQMQMMQQGANNPNINRIQNRGGASRRANPIRNTLSGGANGNYVRPSLAR